MNRLHFRNINKVAASLVCVVGMLASSAALATGKRHRVKLDDLDAKRFYDGDVYIWGELDGYSYRDKLEIQVRATVRVTDDCYDYRGRRMRGYGKDHELTIWDYKRIGSLYGDKNFHLDLEVDKRIGYSAYCPNRHWRAKRRVKVEHVHVRVLRGYGYGYGYDRDYDCHHQGYDCGSDYYGYDPSWGHGYGYGYGFGYDHGYYGYDDHDHGFGYGFGYDYDHDFDYGYRGYDFGYGDYSYSDYRYGKDNYRYHGYDYGYDDPGYYDYDYGYVLATGDCWFDYYSRHAYCDYY